MPMDPVCGMEIGDDSQFKSKSGGMTVYFCCPHCKSRFNNDSAKFNA
ncbi:MAG: YHS domain-containing protein [Nitrososphaera sp.]